MNSMRIVDEQNMLVSRRCLVSSFEVSNRLHAFEAHILVTLLISGKFLKLWEKFKNEFLSSYQNEQLLIINFLC